jgi:hypothetical protein
MSKLQIDILIYIALSEEFDILSDELIKKFNFISKKLDNLPSTIFNGRVSSPVLNKDFEIAVVPVGKMGNIASAVVVSKICEQFDVRNIVVLGFTG